MNNLAKCLYALLVLSSLLMVACSRNSNEMWEDTKSAGRHLNRGLSSLGGKQGDSRAVSNKEDFMAGGSNQSTAPVIPYDYVPLNDLPSQDGSLTRSNVTHTQPKESPGEEGSTLPGIDKFQDPKADSQWANVFKNVQFGYNTSLIKGQENLDVLRHIANYMKKHPNVYIFVEGHCDERGAEAYNLALGARRSNSVRNMLIADGVNPENIFTISYGKEHPVVEGHDEEAWSINRRAHFRLYRG